MVCSPSNAKKSWFNGGCQSLFVDNLPNNPSNLSTTITSSVFSVGLSGNYELELEYGLIYSGTAPIFEFIDSSNAVISPTSTTTVAGTCTDWPNAKNSKLVFIEIIDNGCGFTQNQLDNNLKFC